MTSTAFPLAGVTVRVTERLKCPNPNCGAELRACDVIVDRATDGAVLICFRCHRDILIIEGGPTG